MAHLTGVKGLDQPPPVQDMIQVIGPAEHLVFILLDGLGMNVIRRLPAASFLVAHLKTHIRATCPSTTASALTSVATAEWPIHHAVTGWFTHLPEFGLTATMLPFTERFSQQPLAQRGLNAQSVLPVPAYYPRMTCRSLTLLPNPIVNTTYATYSRGYTPGAGYSTVADAVDQMIAHILGAGDEPTYTHLYVPDIDTLCHKRGIDHASVVELVMQIDLEMARLADAVARRARIVISADHGLIDVPLANHYPIYDDDPILPLLTAPPSGDGRLPLFHVREGRQQEFTDMFNHRFSERMVLLSIEEAERMHLFGPGPLSPIARRRFGSFAGIALGPATLLYHPPTPPAKVTREPYLAQHAGLSPEEMDIPLIIA